MKQEYTVPACAHPTSTLFNPLGWQPFCFLLIIIIFRWTCCLSILISWRNALQPTLPNTSSHVPSNPEKNPTKTQWNLCFKGIKDKKLFATESCWEKKISFLQWRDTGYVCYIEGWSHTQKESYNIHNFGNFLKGEHEVGWVGKKEIILENSRREINIITIDIYHEIMKE